MKGAACDKQMHDVGPGEEGEYVQKELEWKPRYWWILGLQVHHSLAFKFAGVTLSEAENIRCQYLACRKDRRFAPCQLRCGLAAKQFSFVVDVVKRDELQGECCNADHGMRVGRSSPFERHASDPDSGPSIPVKTISSTVYAPQFLRPQTSLHDP